MEHTVDFFRDEVRNGFYIPTAIKQAWAATLDVLAEIDRICRKYDIRYFADWGTFLGAVRHGGFVPWDDDLDICMLRDDYMKFRRVADLELPKEYVIHDYEGHQDHWLFLARVVNNARMCFDISYLNAHNNFPWLAGVDIFIKDYLYADEEEEISRDKEILNIIALADGIREGELSGKSVAVHISEIGENYHVDLAKEEGTYGMAVALYRLAEQQMARVKPNEAKKVGQIFPWVLKHGPKAGEEKNFYQSIIRLPFEDTTIPVPAAYHTVLTRRYGNYNEIRKVWGGHKYPFYEAQIEEMERLSGERLPGFVFDSSMLRRAEPDRSGSLKAIANECLFRLEELIKKTARLLQEGKAGEIEQSLTDSQQLAIELGTLIEQVKGEKRDTTLCVIGALQRFCDAVWEKYQEVESGKPEGSLSTLQKALDEVEESVESNILKRKEILFLPVGPKEWNAFEPFYEKLQDGKTDLYVVPLPLMKKTFLGEITMSDGEIEDTLRLGEYPQKITYTDWTSYDLGLHCPEEIYVQNPYDGTNPCLTVPPMFYVKNLQLYTDRITYIPVSETAEFGKDDIIDQYNLKHYVTAPGVVYADKVIVQSENIKEQYVNVLTAFAGEETRNVWKNKIIEGGFSVKKDTEKTGAKSILYCIGANELTEHGDILMKSMQGKLRIFADAGAELRIAIALYPCDKLQWSRINDKLSDELFELIDKTILDKKYEKVNVLASEADETATLFDAYYGSPSPFVPAFITKGKPVMLADYGIDT